MSIGSCDTFTLNGRSGINGYPVLWHMWENKIMSAKCKRHEEYSQIAGVIDFPSYSNFRSTYPCEFHQRYVHRLHCQSPDSSTTRFHPTSHWSCATCAMSIHGGSLQHTCTLSPWGAKITSNNETSGLQTSWFVDPHLADGKIVGPDNYM